MNRLFAAFCLLILPSLLHAQPVTELRVPESARWVVEMKPVDPEADPERVLPLGIRRIEVFKQGGTRRYVLEMTDGRTSEVWAIGAYVLYRHPAWRADLYYPYNANSEEGAPFSQDFFELRGLLRPEYYKGRERLGNQEADMFQSEDRTVWISASTRLPLMDRNAAVIRTYRFKDSPAAKLDPPADVRAAIERFNTHYDLGLYLGD